VNKIILTVAIALATACGSAAAQTLFFDDFNNEFPGLNRVPNGWTVTNGTVDIIGNGPNGELFDARPGNGYYIDLDGSSNPPNAGLLATGLTFAAGTAYELSFDLGNSGTAPNTMVYGINFDSALAPDFLVPVTEPIPSNFRRVSLLFSTPVATTGRIVFDHQGGDLNGLLLDDVRVAVIPEPQTWGLLLAGLGLMGIVARRRKKGRAIA
jgi:hypothetical protein